MTYKEVREKARFLRSNQTEAELFFWSKVRRRQVSGFKFNRQFVIQHTFMRNAIRKYFITDFYCHELKLIVEIDGGYHDKLRQKEYDQARENKLTELGFRVIRYKNNQVLNHWETVLIDLSKKMKS